MNPQRFGSDLADIRIRILINSEIRIRSPDHFQLRLDALAEVCALWARSSYYYGRPLSVSGRPCYILPMFFYIYLFIFYGRLILRPWLTEVRENFTPGRP